MGEWREQLNRVIKAKKQDKKLIIAYSITLYDTCATLSSPCCRTLSATVPSSISQFALDRMDARESVGFKCSSRMDSSSRWCKRASRVVRVSCQHFTRRRCLSLQCFNITDSCDLLALLTFLCACSSSTFMSPTAPMTIRIKQTQAISEGDVMREVDGLALAGDWLLVKAGYIGNLELETAVTDFTAKRKKDPSLLMECIVTSRTRRCVLFSCLQQVSSADLDYPCNSTRASAPAKTSTHVMSSEKQLLHYLHQPQYPARKRTHFPLEHIESGKTLLVRTDLESVGVDICNMEVPALFVENFDYQNMRPDFINGVLTSDLLGKSISCTVIGEGQSLGTTSPRAQPWAAHVSDVSSYASIR